MQVAREGKVVRIARVLRIAEAERFRDGLLPLLTERGYWELDLPGGEAFDTAALHILFFLLASCTANRSSHEDDCAVGLRFRDCVSPHGFRRHHLSETRVN